MDTSLQIPISSIVILAGANFKAFQNALNNYTPWVDIFISALEGAHVIPNFDLKELKNIVSMYTVISQVMLLLESLILENTQCMNTKLSNIDIERISSLFNVTKRRVTK